MFRAALLAAAVSSCQGESDEAIRTVRVLDLVTAFPRATLEAPAPEYVLSREEMIGNDQRRVIFMHPTSSAEFPAVAVDARSMLLVAIAIQDEAWDKPGDGVEFRVQATGSDNRPMTVFSRYIDPKRNEAERGWIDVRVPLSAFAGQAMRLTLSTVPGPDGNNDSDWAVWAGRRYCGCRVTATMSSRERRARYPPVNSQPPIQPAHESRQTMTTASTTILRLIFEASA